jgi:hypothetical protein
MANIPVERTGGTPWWAWLLGLLALLAVGWLVLELFDEEPDADERAGLENNVGPIDDLEIGGDGDVYDPNSTLLPIETEDDLYVAMDDYATTGEGEGREVNLRGVEVMRLSGDSSFVIGSGERETLVILSSLGESESGPGDGSDGRFNVDEGDMVTITGAALTRYRDKMPGTSELTDADREMAERRQLTLTVREAGNITVDG